MLGHVHRIRPILIHVGVFSAAVHTTVSEERQQKGVTAELKEMAVHTAVSEERQQKGVNN
jgi:hypothetical protein